MAYQGQYHLFILVLAVAVVLSDPIQKTGATVGPHFARQEGHKEDLDNRKHHGCLSLVSLKSLRVLLISVHMIRSFLSGLSNPTQILLKWFETV